MNRAEFDRAIAGLPLAKAEFYETIGSTNDVVAEWARQGATGLSLAAADEQTQGRGRSGRSWFTPPKSALALSLLLEQASFSDTAHLGRVSGLGALAACEAFEELFQAKPEIKWPNDVLLNGKKVCGVLPESRWSGENLQRVILGIGINIATASVPPPEMTNFPAACLEDVLGVSVDAGKLLRVVLKKIIMRMDKISEADFLLDWETRLAYKGKRVSLIGAGQTLKGKLTGLATDGRLKLQMASGDILMFEAGVVHGLALD